MKSHPTERIRNVVLVGHSGSGKTTLAEALLARSGTLQRVGRVDDGTSVLDTEPESTKRRISLSLALAPFEWRVPDGNTFKINLIDSPGYADFVGEVQAAFAVVDLAVFVVSAVEGIEVQTELMWRRAAELNLPRLVFINKEDKERANFHAVLTQLQTKFGAGVIPLELPLGEATALHGVADVLSEAAFEYEADGTHHTEPMPGDIEAEQHQLHEALIETIVASNDDQLERYLGGDVPAVSELERTLALEVLGCREFPVLVGSALTGVGLDRLADFICELGPSPADRPRLVSAGDQQVPVTADSAAQQLIHVFKTIADPFVGQLSVFKVLSGTVSTDDHLVNTRSGHDERLHGLFILRGKEQETTTTFCAGDLGAVAKLNATLTGDTLAPRGTPVRVLTAPWPVPQYGVAVVPHSQADDDKLGNALSRLQAEDPSLLVDRPDETHQTILRGFGDTHVTVAIERLARKFGVAVETNNVRVPYRETILRSAEAEGKVKKQTGGHGQFAVANLRVAPLLRGDGFAFVDAVVGGAIPHNYLPAVQRGIEEAMAHGGVHGFPVVDVRVECFDGKFHSVDSSEMAFRAAAAHGFKDALAAAEPVVLEPISLLHITVPITHQGDVMSDITSRRGRVQGTDVTAYGEQQIVAYVPTGELGRYAIDLRSMTGGRGQFSRQHDHYEVLPTHLVEQAKATLKA